MVLVLKIDRADGEFPINIPQLDIVIDPGEKYTFTSGEKGWRAELYDPTGDNDE